MQPADRHPPRDPVLAHPGSGKLREGHDSMLAVGNLDDRKIGWGDFIPHGRE